MQKIKYIILILIFMSGCSGNTITENAKIYYIDHELMALIGVNCTLEGETTLDIANKILIKLQEGQDFNRKIKRQIPDISHGMTVTIDNKCATVNLSNEFVSLHENGRIPERLTVYQIVNSLTSLKEIDSVCFTIDNKPQKNFKGFLDMRETFKFKPHVL